MKKLALALISAAILSPQAHAGPHEFTTCLKAAADKKPYVKETEETEFVKQNCAAEARDTFKECVSHMIGAENTTPAAAKLMCAAGMVAVVHKIINGKAQITAASGNSDAAKLSLGALTSEGPRWTKQVIALKNTGSRVVGMAFVECGFFKNGSLVGNGIGIISNLAPNQTGYDDINVNQSADSARCRVSSVTFQE